MTRTEIYNAVNKPVELEKQAVVDFLFDNLEQYGDPKSHILKAINYSIKEYGAFGGFTLVQKDGDTIIGTVVMNHTGMGGYIPENILVYIATHKDYRGKGLGKKLMKKAIEFTNGDIALHVEASNPAIHLYEKLGFDTPYLEMRLKK